MRFEKKYIVYSIWSKLSINNVQWATVDALWVIPHQTCTLFVLFNYCIFVQMLSPSPVLHCRLCSVLSAPSKVWNTSPHSILLSSLHWYLELLCWIPRLLLESQMAVSHLDGRVLPIEHILPNSMFVVSTTVIWIIWCMSPLTTSSNFFVCLFKTLYTSQ